MTDTEPKQRTITLTGRAPVRIREDVWPIVANATVGDADPNKGGRWTYRASMFVRQHEDGRRLVYGVFTAHEGDEPDRKHGELLTPSEEIGPAVERVAKRLDYEPEQLAHDLLADMPAEPLD